MSKIKKALQWWTMNTILWGATITGIVYNYHHLLNVSRFFIWFLAFNWFVMNLGKIGSKKIGMKFPYMERSVPGGLSFASDFGLAVLFAAFGHWFYAILTLFQQYLEMTFYHKPPTEGKE